MNRASNMTEEGNRKSLSKKSKNQESSGHRICTKGIVDFMIAAIFISCIAFGILSFAAAEGSDPPAVRYMKSGIRSVNHNMHVLYKAYYDEKGNLETQAAGHVAIEQEWDSNWNLISRTYLDETGQPMMRKDGYAKAIWEQNDNGTWNVHLLNLEGKEVPLRGKNLVQDVKTGEDGWTEWMTPNTGVENYCFNIGFVNLGPRKEGDVYTSTLEIEFKGVTAMEGQAFRFWTQGAQDGKWFTGNVWNSSIVYLEEVPDDRVYRYTSTVTVSGGMVNVSMFNVGFRCDYWNSGMFRVRNVKIEKGNTSSEWTAGL